MRVNFTKKAILTGLATILVAAGAFVAVLSMTGGSTNAFSVGDRRDCGYDDVIVDCGATSINELLQVYNSNNDRRGNRDIQAIFHHYGIKGSDITGATSDVKKGWLNTNGTIVVDGKIVADGAQSLYRVHPGKQVTPKIIGGKTYYSGPVAGNYGLGADLFVFFNKDGTFRSAIQASCGNPIAATNKVTPPKPVYTCDNLVAKKLDRARFSFTSSASVKNNAQIVSYTYNFGDGNTRTVNSTATTNTVEHTYNTKEAKSFTVRVTVNFTVNGKAESKTGTNCQTTVKVEAEPKPPVYACTNLTSRKLERNKFEFTSTASASNGAKVVSYNYDFGDGTVRNNQGRTITHTYNTTDAKTYTVTMTANIEVNGKVQKVPGANCKTTVKVEGVPAFKCESLKITQRISRTEFRFTATASAKYATIKSYTFTFGDGNSQVVDTGAKTASVVHSYDTDKAATYTARVVITMSDGKTTTSDNCKVTVNVTEKPDPAIVIEKTVNGKKHDKVAVGEEFTYEITVRNTGNVILKDADVRDYAPRHVTFISASEGSVGNNVWTYTIPELAVNDSKSFTITAVYEKYAEGVHKNKVCVDTPTIPDGPDDCDDATTETDEPIKVCDLTDNTIKTIQRSEFDEATMTTDLSECDEIEVCIIKDKTIKTIHRNEFDESTMTTDLSECDEELPPELPQTGIDTLIGGGLGLGSITAAGYYWVASRRNLVSVLLNK